MTNRDKAKHLFQSISSKADSISNSIRSFDRQKLSFFMDAVSSAAHERYIRKDDLQEAFFALVGSELLNKYILICLIGNQEDDVMWNSSKKNKLIESFILDYEKFIQRKFPNYKIGYIGLMSNYSTEVLKKIVNSLKEHGP